MLKKLTLGKKVKATENQRTDFRLFFLFSQVKALFITTSDYRTNFRVRLAFFC
ncbi:hypothetical protein RU93_GL000713 [Enterococcus aquimarinus]|uniref:Uncharacterized protein n=1 Tax=Enterococcus aquimarinus TaxID=328396 RepID=A0A1L8QPW0_9ENTE|nr:hypothetical protein RU93_GL000713 [Enterococcus aquimarinus]